jgi:hypothetical protein
VTGQPLAGVTIQLGSAVSRNRGDQRIGCGTCYLAWREHAYVPVRTDKRGRFQYPHLAQIQQTLVATHDGYLDQPFRVSADEGLDVQMNRGATVTGRVLDEQGQPAAHSVVEMLSQSDNPSPYATIGASRDPKKYSSSTKDAGNSITGLAPGRYRAWVTQEDRNDSNIYVKVLDVAADSTMTVDFLPRTGGAKLEVSRQIQEYTLESAFLVRGALTSPFTLQSLRSRSWDERIVPARTKPNWEFRAVPPGRWTLVTVRHHLDWRRFSVMPIELNDAADVSLAFVPTEVRVFGVADFED